MKIAYKKLNERAVAPVYGSDGSAGGDLFSSEENDVIIAPGETAFVGTGLAVEIPDGYVGLVYARSGLACKRGLAPANKVGVIDSDYRRVEYEEVSGLSDTVRGEGGFGSTGRK